jgi:hypothetical protein
VAALASSSTSDARSFSSLSWPSPPFFFFIFFFFASEE